MEVMKEFREAYTDGYRSCPMMVNGTCEKCLRDLNEAIQGG